MIIVLGRLKNRPFIVVRWALLEYRIIRSSRKTMASQITPNGEVVVRCPLRVSAQRIREFVESKAAWIEKHMEKVTRMPQNPKLTETELHRLAEDARQLIPERVAVYAPLVGVTWGKITIRKQKSRWGSCSSLGNLNFNCLLMLAPRPVLDYVVVHELCHRKEMNHSVRFWAEVERILPDYRNCRNWLKENGNCLMAVLPVEP